MDEIEKLFLLSNPVGEWGSKRKYPLFHLPFIWLRVACWIRQQLFFFLFCQKKKFQFTKAVSASIWQNRSGHRRWYADNIQWSKYWDSRLSTIILVFLFFFPFLLKTTIKIQKHWRRWKLEWKRPYETQETIETKAHERPRKMPLEVSMRRATSLTWNNDCSYVKIWAAKKAQ